MTPGGTCRQGLTSCNGQCSDLSVDIGNCGACGNTCHSGQPCVNGQCGCKGGQTLCNGGCPDLTSDINNCGSCGNACPTGSICRNSKCLNTSTVCPPGQTECSDRNCADLTSDNMNCGSCGNVCQAYSKCTNSVCVGMEDINTLECPQGQIECNGQCVDDTSDNNNCGGCGRICPAGSQCNNAQCWIPGAAPTLASPTSAGSSTVCSSGQTNCGGTCTNTQSDSSNCGSCNNVCPGLQSCSGGTCGCSSGMTNCGGTCANTQNSLKNCGSCGVVCGAGQDCENGKCITFCPSGSTTTGNCGSQTYSRPTVTSISPSSGRQSIGVLIRGTGFTGVTNVYFGSEPSQYGFRVLSSTVIAAGSPQYPPGTTIDVTVVTPGGTSATSPADQFTYQ
ncbi:hypothetical protein [Methanoregula sp.]|uniref:hypothetical protein n=1 Tax=Methanoregula sp. TaxID=2052170 RepID=UPI003C7496C6